VTGNGADGDSVALATTDAVVDVADVLGPPGRVAAVADDDVGGFDAPPLRCGVLRERPI
jgi:hypothetical protein